MDNNSIANRVAQYWHTPRHPTNDSIATRILARRRDSAHTVIDMETGQALKYQQLLRHPKFKDAWNTSTANEFGCLAQGVGGQVKGTNTIKFISKSEVPNDRFKDVTYIKFVCSVCTEKSDPNHTRATMGGNLINFQDDIGTITSTVLLINIFLNSVISTPRVCFMSINLANFYIMTPLKQPEFSKIMLSNISEEIRHEYKLH